MIALLTGRLDSLDSGSCIIDVAGVGYLVQASTRTLSTLPSQATQVRLLIETVVREDAILLYGFADSAERDWFRLLTTVQGVGAKVALAILSALSPAELVGAIASADRVSLTRVPGVGPKLAIRLLTELRDRAGAMPSGPPSSAPRAGTAPPSLADDALSALANLGYRRLEAHPIVSRALEALGAETTLDAVIRQSLRDLAR